MAIDTINKKLALLEYEELYQPCLPISSDGLDQADNQQLLAGYPGILWEIKRGEVSPWLVSSKLAGVPEIEEIESVVVGDDIVAASKLGAPRIVGDRLSDRGRK